MSQLLPFSCGPACLIKALIWQGLDITNDLETQIKIWRTANTVFMGAGPAGCDSIGLAKAAENYGSFMQVIRLQPKFTFAHTVRDKAAKDVILNVESANMRYLSDRARLHAAGVDEIGGHITNERPIILLCSMRGFSSSNEYHWIAKRGPQGGSEIYDPYNGQYGITIKQRFFDEFLRLDIAEFAKLNARFVIDILN
jgi:hypothetical protein